MEDAEGFGDGPPPDEDSAGQGPWRADEKDGFFEPPFSFSTQIELSGFTCVGRCGVDGEPKGGRLKSPAVAVLFPKAIHAQGREP